MISARPRTSRALSLRTLAIASLPLASFFACSANSTSGTFTTGTTSSTSGSGGSAAQGTVTGTGGTGEGGGVITVGSGGSGGSGGQESCAQATAEAKIIPLVMFIAIDKSGSMIDSNKWGNVSTAFIGTPPAYTDGFFEDPAAAGIGVALRFWPDDNGGCDDDFSSPTCVNAIPLCEIPEVDNGPLSDPAHVQALIDSFNAHTPNGITPTSAALEGATKWAAKYTFAKNHTEQAVVVLVTDGEPTACDTDVVNIAAIADKAYQGAGVLTFAVGLAGSGQATMDQIAVGGHTGQAFMIGNGNAAKDLLTALQTIQAAAVSCTFKMPTPPDPNDKIDIDQVDVNYTPTGGVKTMFPQVANAAQCGVKGGWYYDNPTMPTTINLCPATCTQVQADQTGKIEIFLGCIKKGPA